MTQDPNPYLPPHSNLATPERALPVVPAGNGRRLGTLLIDYALFIVFSFCVGLFIGIVFGQAGAEALQQVPDLLFGCAVLSAYYIFFEGIWGRTPGKFLLGTVVVNEAGGKPSLKQVIGRTLCRFIPFEAFSFLGERGWHDSIPKTYVVMVR